jgi:Protein of unknown function (DUF1194)
MMICRDISIRHDQSSDAPSRRYGRLDAGGPPRSGRPGQGRSASLFVAHCEEKLFAYRRTSGSAWRALFKTMLTVRAIAALAATFVVIGYSPAARAGDDIDMLLVLGADASYSIDAPKFELQRQGYAKAIVNPRVINAIVSGVSGRIAVCYFEWSGAVWQDLIIDWTVIGSLEAAQRFGENILLAPRSYPERTSISAAIDFASKQFARAPWVSHRRVIDISGDGDNNAGRGVTTARDEAVAKGITINGLAILSLSNDLRDHINPPGGLEQYYRRNVIGGLGAFVVVSVGFESFGDALIKKLTTEIAAPRYPRYAVQGEVP